MSTRGVSPGADAVGIEIVIRRVSAKPAHGSLTIFDLRRKRCSAGEAVIDAGHGVSILHQSYSWTSLFSALAPASSVDPNNHRQRTRDLFRTIEVEREDCAVDAFIYQISQSRHTGNLRRPTPRHNRLRDLPTQHRRRKCESKPWIPPSYQPDHVILGCHIADTILFNKNLPARMLDWQELFNIPGLGIARRIVKPSLTASSFLHRLCSNSFFPNS